VSTVASIPASTLATAAASIPASTLVAAAASIPASTLAAASASINNTNNNTNIRFQVIIDENTIVSRMNEDDLLNKRYLKMNVIKNGQFGNNYLVRDLNDDNKK
jgi:hypothetical protein